MMVTRLARAASVASLAGVLLAALSVAALAQSQARGAAHVYFFRGLMDISVGLDEMAQRVRRRGVTASVHSHGDWSSFAEAAVAAYRSGRERTIVLVGHSLGAAAAIQMAERLGASGVPVRLIVTLDPVAQMAAPGNVRRLVNLYIPRGIGEPIGGGHNTGSVANIQLNEDTVLDHFTMDRTPQIQRRVLSQIFAALASVAPKQGKAAHRQDGAPTISAHPSGIFSVPPAQ
jgi:pimeloyl-ACP methyl ester carboxylesterase